MLQRLATTLCPVLQASARLQPASLLWQRGAATDGSSPLDVKGMANKLLYRSKQRGFLELDLLVGLWAEREVPRMDMPMLEHLAVVLDQENPDLFKWITGQLPPSEDMEKNPAFQALKVSALEMLSKRSQPATRAPAGTDWVRGWDDKSAGSWSSATSPAAAANHQ